MGLYRDGSAYICFVKYCSGAVIISTHYWVDRPVTGAIVRITGNPLTACREWCCWSHSYVMSVFMCLGL